MNRLIILGSGAAPGVPSLSRGWGKCDSANPKNRRMRIGTYVEYEGLKLVIDTSPDLRVQLLNHNLRYLDFVLYTHTHADHLNGIDDLREINRISRQPVSIFSTGKIIKEIRHRFGYLMTQKKKLRNFTMPRLTVNTVKTNHPFYLKGVKITPIKLLGHHNESIGYVFDDGELVYIPDFKEFSLSAMKAVKKKPKILIIPLTTTYEADQHASLKTVKEYIEKIDADRTIINHMSTDCDYDEINRLTGYKVFPAFDGMKIEF